MLRPLFTSALIALAVLPAEASTYLAGNGLVVRATSGSTFDIDYRGRSAVRDFWCAAGHYVRYELNKSGNTRIYRTSAGPRGSGEGISFSLSSDGAQPSGLAIIGGNPGIRAVHAVSLCDTDRIRQ